MEKLIQQFHSRLQFIDLTFKRYLCKEIDWNNRLIAIVGARGVGKTTLLLQHIKQTYKNLDEVLYVSLDHLYFSKNSLSDFVDEFVKLGGKYLYIDEVHKYPNWSREIKNIYDNYPMLSMVITGSSALDIHKRKGDLSRRMLIFKMNGLSFREFVQLKYQQEFKTYTLEELLKNATSISQEINSKIKPLKLFKEYLRIGYYPFFTEGETYYDQRLEQAVNEIIETELPALEPIGFEAVYNIKKLLMLIAELVPFKPNILKLSRQIGINRDTFIKYLYWLQRADLLLLLNADTYGIAKMNKPEKVYLNNPNLIYALSEKTVNIGTVRETFFYNQLSVNHKVFYSGKADFLVNNKYTFEIGGKNKSKKQISGIDNAFIVADNIEYAYKNTIPVWLFGFLY